MADRLASDLLVVHEPAMDAYVAQLGAALARYANSPFACAFTLYEGRRTTEPLTNTTPPAIVAAMPLDAFRGSATEPVAVAGGFIFIPMSLLAGAPNEAVFAFQLAHAMAHVSARHATRLATRMELMEISAQVAQNASMGSQQDHPAGLGLIALSRAVEREADYLAVQILSQAGYNPVQVMEYLTEQPEVHGSVAKAFALRPPPAAGPQPFEAKSRDSPPSPTPHPPADSR
ncbi:MAG TPA: M48 family metalloprotease [Bryobacteraceae bacterium]|nr:M48 family metalloprotease [Bryobacteraceae bacterium]